MKKLWLVVVVVMGFFFFGKLTTVAFAQEKDFTTVFSEIKLNLDDEDIEIKKSSDEYYHVNLLRCQNTVKVAEIDHQLKIFSVKDTRHWWTHFFSFSFNSKVILEVPEKWLEKVEIRIENGDIRLKNVLSKIIAVHSENGDVRVVDTQSKTGNIELENGDLYLKNSDLGEIKFVLKNGDIRYN